MNKAITGVGLLLLVPFLPLRAQEHKRVSPHETVSATIDGANIKIVYGRPYTRDPKTQEKRKIWGGLVPFGQVWRMGADEATMLTTDHDIAIGGTRIPAGSYTLFLQPEENGPAKLIVNKQTGQWGTKYKTPARISSASTWSGTRSRRPRTSSPSRSTREAMVTPCA